MNEIISWDPSLVKKFSSSNHYKLLNQLRNEVKKYPLNNKKNSSTNQSNDSNIDNKNKFNISQIENSQSSNCSNLKNEADINKTTVSFNNAKNFSIYNQTTNNNNSRQYETTFLDKDKSNEDSHPTNFKERLDKIDMK